MDNKIVLNRIFQGFLFVIDSKSSFIWIEKVSTIDPKLEHKTQSIDNE